MTKFFWKIKKRVNIPASAEEKLDEARERISCGLKYFQGFAGGKFLIDSLDVEPWRQPSNPRVSSALLLFVAKVWLAFDVFQ